jgi:hypothetical protein
MSPPDVHCTSPTRHVQQAPLAQPMRPHEVVLSHPVHPLASTLQLWMMLPTHCVAPSVQASAQVVTHCPLLQTWGAPQTPPSAQSQQPVLPWEQSWMALPLHCTWPALHTLVQVEVQAPLAQAWLAGLGAVTQS